METDDGRESGAKERETRFVREALRPGALPPETERPWADRLRGRIAHALHAGELRAGDRLPGIRDLADAFGVSRYAAAQAYTALEAEGVVQKRERSGVYVAPPGEGGAGDLPETGRWVADLLAESFEHQVRIPLLPDLIRRYTSTVAVRCACVESTRDHMTALCAEIGQHFGMETHSIPPDALEGPPERLPPALRDADILVTTAYHAPRLRPIAEALGKPLVVATAHPRRVADMERRLEVAGELTVVCADAEFGERIRAIRGGRHADRIRIVLADDSEGLRALDRAEPVVLTLAARERLEGTELRLVTPPHPAFAPEFARELSELLVRLNLDAARKAPRA